jgi:hypothetical protein
MGLETIEKLTYCNITFNNRRYKMTFKIESYDKEPTAFFGHICWTEDTDTLEEAKAIAKKYHDQGNIRVRVLKGSEEVFRYLEVTKQEHT